MGDEKPSTVDCILGKLIKMKERRSKDSVFILDEIFSIRIKTEIKNWE